MCLLVSILKNFFNKLIFKEDNIIEIENRMSDEISYWWIYESKSNLIENIKNKFIAKVLKQVSFCPFCGKTSLTKFEKWRIFDLDHFFPKSKKVNHNVKVYPHLAINLYNLIPACKWCNFLKSNKNFIEQLENWEKIFHPYFGFLIKNDEGKIIPVDESLDEKYSFSGNHKKEWKKKEIIYNSKHSNFFELGNIYFNSQDTAESFAFIQEQRTKLLEEKQRFKKTSKTNEELKKYFFKNYAPQSKNEILKFSNGKFKKDLIDNLKLPNN